MPINTPQNSNIRGDFWKKNPGGEKKPPFPPGGIDVGAKYEIYKLMSALGKKGMSFIRVSELSEVMASVTEY